MTDFFGSVRGIELMNASTMIAMETVESSPHYSMIKEEMYVYVYKLKELYCL